MNDPNPAEIAKSFGNPYLVTSDDSEELSGGLPAGSSMNAPSSLQHFARVGQIITIALAKGMLVIGVVLIVMRWGQPADPFNLTLPLIGTVLFIVILVLAWIVPAAMRARAIHQFRQSARIADWLANSDATAVERLIDQGVTQPLPLPAKRLLTMDQTARMVSHGLLEGVGVVNLVFFMLNGNAVHLVWPVILWVAIVVQIPTVSRYRALLAKAMS